MTPRLGETVGQKRRRAPAWVPLRVMPLRQHGRAVHSVEDSQKPLLRVLADEGASNAEINRELAILKRAFKLAIHPGKLQH